MEQYLRFCNTVFGKLDNGKVSLADGAVYVVKSNTYMTPLGLRVLLFTPMLHMKWLSVIGSFHDDHFHHNS